MPSSYKYEFDTPKPSLANNGLVGTCYLGVGHGKEIRDVKASLDSGKGTLNFNVGTAITSLDDFDDWPGEFLWHLRAEDLATVYADDDPVEAFWSYQHFPHKFVQTYSGSGSDERPAYKADEGISNGTDTAKSLYFSGIPRSHMLNDTGGGSGTGTFTLDYDASFTFVVVVGNHGIGSYRPFCGENHGSSSRTIYGDWGRHKIRKNYPEEYSHASALTADNQIRVMTMNNSSSIQSRVNEWINGTAAYTNQAITISSSGGSWIFDMLGGFKSSSITAYQGGLTEFMLLEGSLSTDQRELIEGHLAHKYGVANGLPSGHTYYLTDPNPSTSGLELSTSHTLTSSIATVKSSMSTSITHGQAVSFYMPQCQNASGLTVQITTT